jgi:hypothetical protein
MNLRLYRLKNRDLPDLSKAEVCGAVTLGGLIFLLIVFRVLAS